MTTKLYSVNDMFLSLQGEGMRTGTMNVFVRFAGCNLACSKESHGFDCDTEFVSSRHMTAEEIADHIWRLWGKKEKGPPDKYLGIIFTGGEPALQLDKELIAELRRVGAWTIAIETNGSICVDGLDLDWITVSPKVAEHAIQQKQANEVKYVRNVGQGIPRPTCVAPHRLISPAFDGDDIVPGALKWCMQLVKENPDWILMTQRHKEWKVR